MSKRSRAALLHERVQAWEKAGAETTQRLAMSKPTIVRVDGNNFSRFTKQYCGDLRPADPRVAVAMRNTMLDLCKFMNAKTAYTFSDEISIILAPSTANHRKATSNPMHPFLYGGRVQKIASLASAYTSTRFSYHLFSQGFGEGALGCAFFDGRVFQVPGPAECVEYLMARMVDCLRNSQMSYARKYLPPSKLEGRSNRALLAHLKSEMGADWDAMPAWFKHGSCVKKTLIEKDGFNPKSDTRISVIRSHYSIANIPFSSLTPEDNDADDGVYDFENTGVLCRSLRDVMYENAIPSDGHHELKSYFEISDYHP